MQTKCSVYYDWFLWCIYNSCFKKYICIYYSPIRHQLPVFWKVIDKKTGIHISSTLSKEWGRPGIVPSYVHVIAGWSVLALKLTRFHLETQVFHLYLLKLWCPVRTICKSSTARSEKRIIANTQHAITPSRLRNIAQYVPFETEFSYFHIYI